MKRLLALAAALALGGCVVDRTGRSASFLLEQRVDDGRARVQVLERDLAAEVARVQVIEEKAEASRRRLADSGATLETFLEEMQTLRGQVADLQLLLREDASNLEVVDFRLQAMEARLAFIEKKLNITPPLVLPLPKPAEKPGSVPTAGTPAAPSAPAAEAPPEDSDAATLAASGDEVVVETAALSDEDLLFQQGVVFMKKKEYEKAGSKLQRFVNTYPDSARAVEAQFLVAQCFFELGRHKAAIASYQKVIDRAESSTWAPKAMFMQGLAFEELGTPDDLEAARVFFGEVVRLYPSAPDAERAKRKLEGMR